MPLPTSAVRPRPGTVRRGRLGVGLSALRVRDPDVDAGDLGPVLAQRLLGGGAARPPDVADDEGEVFGRQAHGPVVVLLAVSAVQRSTAHSDPSQIVVAYVTELQLR